MFLTELIESYYSDYRNHATKENEVLVCCPFCTENGHSPDTEHKLGINTANEVAHCHRCDWRAGGRNLYYALADETNVKDEYETELEKEGPSQLVEKKVIPSALKRIKLPKEYEPLWEEGLDSLGKKARRYLLDRGITSSQIHKHRLGFCGSGKYGYRIILPVIFKGNTVGYTGRTFANAEPKYLNSDGEKFLYNFPNKRKDRCMLFEGAFDVFALERYVSQRYDCIGRFGSILTDLQVKMLGKYKEIVVWPDIDSAGIYGILDVVDRLKKETDVVVKSINPSNDMISLDPGEMTMQQKAYCIKSIKPWSEALANKLLVRVLF